MRKTVIISIGFIFILGSCRPKTTQITQQEETVIISDTLKIQENTEEVIPENIPKLSITPRFFSLIQHIDSLGYIFDTLRYTPHKPYELIQQDKYVLFEIPKETTNPFWTPSWAEEAYSNRLADFDIKPLEKAQKVIQYFFIVKQRGNINEDGLIEEWTFENETEALAAFNSFKTIRLDIMYFNTGAFICCIDKQMYIFHSRASAFMYKPLKSFFKWFVGQNDITMIQK